MFGMAGIRDEAVAFYPGEFLDPVAFIRSDHERQLRQCDRLDRLVDDLAQAGARKEAAELLRNFITDLPCHIADEEELCPLLRRRSLQSDEIDGVIDQLVWEHARDKDLAGRIMVGLEKLIADEEIETPLDFILHVLAFVETQRRHIAWENATVLPLAGRRLKLRDLAELGRAMAARRGAPYPG